MMVHSYPVHIDLPVRHKRVWTEEDERKSQARFDKQHRKSWRNRRRQIREGSLLTAEAFCRMRGISRGELTRLELRRDIFSVDIDHRYYYPRELAVARGVRLSRLTRVCRRLREWVEGWSRYDVVIGGRWETLGGRTVVQSVHRPKAIRCALAIADARSENWAPR